MVKGFLDITGEYIQIILQLLQLFHVYDTAIQNTEKIFRIRLQIIREQCGKAVWQYTRMGILQQCIRYLITLENLCKNRLVGCIGKGDMNIIRIQIVLDNILCTCFDFLALVYSMEKQWHWLIHRRSTALCPLRNQRLYELFFLQRVIHIQNMQIIQPLCFYIR